MTPDLQSTRRQYHVYSSWPVGVIVAHLVALDIKVSRMHPDQMTDARKLLDEKIVVWK